MHSQIGGLAEYLYVDEDRLNFYFDQISQQPTEPTELLGFIPLKTPNADATPAQHARQATTHQKAVQLRDYLQRTHQLLHEWYEMSSIPFVLETVRATQVFIPPRKEVLNFPGLTLWISQSDSASGGLQFPRSGRLQGNLYLLEAFPKNDESPVRYTSYSALALLLQELDTELRNSVLGQQIDLNAPTEQLEYQLSRQPLNFLKTLGAQVALTRTITSLYRIRVTFLDSYSEPEFAVTTIGYPIVIAEAGSL